MGRGAHTNLLELVERHEGVRIVVAFVAVMQSRATDLVPVRKTLRARVLARRKGAELSRVHIPVRMDHHASDARGEYLIPP